MEYTINKTKRNLLILSSSFLILYILTMRLFFFFNGPIKIDAFQNVVQKLIYIILYGYIMFVFSDYFRHYKLKLLQILILTHFFMEVILRSGLFNFTPELTWEKAFFLCTISIWIIVTILLIFFLFQIKIKDYSGIRSIRKFAISIILITVLSPAFPLFAKPENVFATQQLLELTSVIPYFFTINFAIKINLKE